MGQAEHLLLDRGSPDEAERRECLMSIRAAALRARDLLRDLQRAATAGSSAPTPPSAGDVLLAVATALGALEAPPARLSVRGGHCFVDAPGSCAPAVVPIARAVGASVSVRNDRLLVTLSLPGTRTEPKARARDIARRLLVIDDDPRVGSAIASLLRTAGHEVETASDGAAGIDRCHARRFDCVFTDLEMRGMNGLEVSRAIKDHDPGAYVVLLSGSDPHKAAEDFKAAGVDRVLTKPVTLEELLGLVDGLYPRAAESGGAA
jgi:CheY-like chemotaxis protein